MTEVRDAVEADIPGIVEMGRIFHALSPHKFMGDFDEEAVARMLKFFIDSPETILLTNGSGAIGGMMARVYFAPEKFMMEESFWYASSGGMDLLQKFIEAAKHIGADFISLSTLENDRTPAIARTISRLGFKAIERRYLMELAPWQ